MLKLHIHGTQYIDEVVMACANDKGDLYLCQDAIWNVPAATDLGGSAVERYVYTPCGELTVYQQTGNGDRDGEGDVDAMDCAVRRRSFLERASGSVAT